MPKTSISMSYDYLGMFALNVESDRHRCSTVLSTDELTMLMAQCQNALSTQERWLHDGCPDAPD